MSGKMTVCARPWWNCASSPPHAELPYESSLMSRLWSTAPQLLRPQLAEAVVAAARINRPMPTVAAVVVADPVLDRAAMAEDVALVVAVLAAADVVLDLVARAAMVLVAPVDLDVLPVAAAVVVVPEAAVLVVKVAMPLEAEPTAAVAGMLAAATPEVVAVETQAEEALGTNIA